MLGGGESLLRKVIRLEAPLFQAGILSVVSQHSCACSGFSRIDRSEPQQITVLRDMRGDGDAKEGIELHTIMTMIGDAPSSYELKFLESEPDLIQSTLAHFVFFKCNLELNGVLDMSIILGIERSW